MEEPSQPDNKEPNAEQEIAELRARLAQTEQRYAASSEEGKRLAAENQQFRMGSVRQDIPRRPEERLSELGIPVDAIDQLVNERVQGLFAPIARSFEARNQVISQYPDYNKFESEIAQFVQADPRLSDAYQRMFQVAPESAMEFALLKFGESRRKAHPGNGRTASDTRAEAALPSSRSGDSRAAMSNDGTESLRRAKEHYEKTGDPVPYVKARLRGVIKDEFLNQ